MFAEWLGSDSVMGPAVFDVLDVSRSLLVYERILVEDPCSSKCSKDLDIK